MISFSAIGCFFSASFVFAETSARVQCIEKPDLALAKRIEMIRRAENSIILETFSLPMSDSSARIIMNEIVKKVDESKKNGKPIKAQILLDDYNHWRWDSDYPIDAFAEALKERGIEFKVFNPVNLMHLGGANKRDHRKMLSIDGKEALVGGRNLGDGHFGMSDRFNFIDTDFWVESNNIPELDKTFANFWNSSLAVTPEVEVVPKKTLEEYRNAKSSFEIKRAQKKIDRSKADAASRASWVKDTLEINDHDKEVLALLEKIIKSQKGTAVYNCPDVQFISDRDPKEWKSRFVQDYLIERLKKAEKNVIISNYLFLPMRGMKDLFADHFHKHYEVDVEILTNDYSAFATEGESSLIGNTVGRRVSQFGKDFTFYMHNSRAASTKWNQWGIDKDAILHHKNFVIDKKTVIGGSYNLHPRSEFGDSELLVIFENCPALAKEVEANLREYMTKGKRYYNDNPESYYCESETGPKNVFSQISDYIASEFVVPLY